MLFYISAQAQLNNFVWWGGGSETPYEIYAGTDSGYIYHSTNTGLTWTTSFVKTGEVKQIRSLFIKNDTVFAGLHSDTSLYKSTNHGLTWTVSNNGLTDNQIMDIDTIGANLYALSRSTGIYISTDCGTSWNSTGFLSYADAMVIIGDTILACFNAGGSSYVKRSIDHGTTWTSVVVSNPSFDIVSQDSIVIAGYGQHISRSNRYGAGGSWSILDTVTTGLPYQATYAFAVNKTTFFADISTRGIYKSIDRGLTWTYSNLAVPYGTVDFHSIKADGNYIFAGSESGLFVSTNNGNTWNARGLTGKWIYSLAIKRIQ